MAAQSQHRGIVVGIDGSGPSEAALRWAGLDAAMREEPMTLVNVNPLGAPWVALGPSMATLPARVTRMQEANGHRILAKATEIVHDTTAGSVSTDAVLRFGAAAPTLIDLSTKARMVVVGSRGHGPVRRTLLGSVSSALIHHAHCPVAVIHEESHPLRTRPVLVGIDGSPASEVATKIAFEEASLRKVELIAFYAWIDFSLAEYQYVDEDVDWPAKRSVAEATLAGLLAGWQQRYPNVAVRRLVRFDDPATHLLHTADSSTQLVVVGSRGRGGFADMLLGSVGRAVAYGARIPVIVARQD